MLFQATCAEQHAQHQSAAWFVCLFVFVCVCGCVCVCGVGWRCQMDGDARDVEVSVGESRLSYLEPYLTFLH